MVQAGLARPLSKSLEVAIAMRRKWKYAKHARRFRKCERCKKKLKLDEQYLCMDCYLEELRFE